MDIDADKASADAIALAVRACPTGALRYVRHDGAPQESPDVPATLTPVLNGPLYVRGDAEIRGLDGRSVRRESRMAVCRCGSAQQMPFCDNTCGKTKWTEPIARQSPVG